MKLFVLLLLIEIAACAVFHSSLKRLTTKRRARDYETRAGVDQPLNTGISYVANVSVGTPPQQFRVLVDTSTSIFYVPDATCDSAHCGEPCDSPGGCEQNFCDPSCCTEARLKTGRFANIGQRWSNCRDSHMFLSNLSLTYDPVINNWTFNYQSTSLGFYGYDVFTVGQPALVVSQTAVGQARLMWWDTGSWGYDGVLGLGMLTNSGAEIQSPIMNAIGQNLLDRPIFTVYLAGPGSNSNGELTFGGLDNRNCRPVIDYVRLEEPYDTYNFRVDGISMAGYSNSAGWIAMTSSIDDFIYGPPNLIQQIASAAGASWASDYYAYLIHCASNPGPFGMKIGSNWYYVQPSNFIWPGTESHSICYFGFKSWVSAGFGPTWSLGTPFLRQHCTVHDIGQRQIGFAQAIVN